MDLKIILSKNMKGFCIFLTLGNIFAFVVSTHSTSEMYFKDKHSSARIKRQTKSTCGDEAPIKWKGLSPNGDKPDEPLVNMVRNAGYSVTVYNAETKDGYFLTMFRIYKAVPNKGTPVLLMHGFASSPSDWLMNDRDKALPYKLVEDGKDVWLGANRGTTFSRRHKTLDESDPKFWDFSSVEYALYDVPAFMDKIQEVTKRDQLYYIGHSLGTRQYFVHMAQYPGNCSRVKAMWALGPAGKVTNLKSVPFRKVYTPFGRLTTTARQVTSKLHQPSGPVFKNITKVFCKAKVACRVCQSILYSIVGYTPQQYNQAWEPTILGHFPDTTSLQLITQAFQDLLNDRLGYMDYGPAENTRIYGKEYANEPPQFNLRNIANNEKCNIHLAYAKEDLLTVPEDVLGLRNELGRAVKSINYLEGFSHSDFLWGRSSHILVYDNIIKEMKRYE